MNRFAIRLFVSLGFVVTLCGCAQQHREAPAAAPAAETTPAAVAQAPATQPMDPVIARIREEGLNNSKAMETLSYICDVIGQRLTGSPNCKHASEWTRDTLKSWGLSNAHLESWGPFGRGWEVKRFSLQVVEPYTIPLNGYPKAWSPGYEKPVDASVVYIEATKEEDLEKYRGKLKGAVVLYGTPRNVDARFEPLARRLDDAALDQLASAERNSNALLGAAVSPRDLTASERRAQFAESGALGERLTSRQRGGGGGVATADAATTRPARGAGAARRQAATSQPASRPSARRRFGDPFASKLLRFALEQGAVAVVTPSSQGDGGTYFVQSATLPDDPSSSTQPATDSSTQPTTRPRVYSKDAPKIVPQITLAVEDYNRLVRMIQHGETLKMLMDLRVKFRDEDLNSYNTIAEIPGTDPKLKDQIVMVGAHLDSWHSGTGATDNGVGSAAAMEAVRIIKALNLKPRRTIRIGLWTGEEEGLLGSAAYVKEHFGHDPDRERERQSFRRPPTTNEGQEPEGGRGNPATQPTTRPRKIVKGPDYEKLSVYFNLDNGTGKIRGIYAQGNEAAVPLFKQWLAPFADLDAKTISMSNTGSTDHISFDAIGLPGFQFIQDPIEYSSRTHHSNEDVYDRIQADDLKQASTIMAAFVWNAANMDDRFPRKPLETQSSR